MKKIIVITGPTGVGKTRLSITIAKHFKAEIINADSMQIYKDLDIGTSKITEAEKENIPHHLLDIKNVDEEYSAYDYQQDGRCILNNTIDNKLVVIVGGTGLYIKALLYDYSFYPNEKKYDYSALSNQQLFDKIKKLDPNISIHINNRRRLERRLNLLMNNAALSTEGNNLLYDVLFIGLTTDREKLYDIIDKRVDKMISQGLIKEVKALYDSGIRSKAVMTGIGYKELYRYFDGDITLDEAIHLIKQHSRRYAKRQYTWFNNQMDIKWFDVDLNNFANTEKKIIAYIEKSL